MHENVCYFSFLFDAHTLNMAMTKIIQYIQMSFSRIHAKGLSKIMPLVANMERSRETRIKN